MSYANYQYYTDNYKGNAIVEQDFDRLILRASDYIDRLTRGNTEQESEAVKMAACAVAEAWQTNEQGGDMISQSVGPWSRTYQKTAKTDDQRLMDAAMIYISDMIPIVRWV